jgi:hypothetical protein
MSFFQKIKDSLYKRSIKNKIGKIKGSEKPMDYHSAKSIGLLFDWKHQKEAFAFADLLKKDGKSVEFLTYVFTEKETNFPEISFFTQKNINWLQIPTGSQVSDFIKIPHDMVFNLSLISKKHLDYIMAVSRGNFKIGPPNEQAGIYHLMYEGHGDLDIFIHNVYDLLKKTIKKHD